MLKIAGVTPLHKKDEKTLIKIYRPVSLIPVVSKLYERNMYNQINVYPKSPFPLLIWVQKML